jgi:hypothetical protein
MPIWYILEGLGMEIFGVLDGRLAFISLLWYIKCQFGIFVAILVHFSQFIFT